MDGDVVGHQRMFTNQLDGMAHAVSTLSKPVSQPSKLDTGIAQGFDTVVGGYCCRVRVGGTLLRVVRAYRSRGGQ